MGENGGMSSPRTMPTTGPVLRGLPRGEVIGRYGTYADAQKAVDHLADEQFEVVRIAIVGNDLKSVEQVTGRLSYPRVAGQGALNGMVFGAFLGMIMSLLGGEQWVSSLVVSVLMGGAFWMLLATVTYAMQRGKRDFTSTNQIVATSYDVVAAPEVAHRARQVLQGMSGPGRPAAHHPGPQHGGPPQGPGPYGPGSYGPGPAHGPGGAGQRPPHAQPADRDAGAPVGSGAPGTEEARREPPRTSGPSALFSDLPDGRPQYGIRLPRDEAQEAARPEQDPGRAADAAEQQPEQGPGEERRDEPPAGGSTAAGAPR